MLRAPRKLHPPTYADRGHSCQSPTLWGRKIENRMTFPACFVSPLFLRGRTDRQKEITRQMIFKKPDERDALGEREGPLTRISTAGLFPSERGRQPSIVSSAYRGRASPKRKSKPSRVCMDLYLLEGRDVDRFTV